MDSAHRGSFPLRSGSNSSLLSGSNAGYDSLASFEQLFHQPDASAPTAPLGQAMRAHFMLADDICYLNHGAFGCPTRGVFDLNQAMRRAIEAEPSAFIRYHQGAATRASAQILADYIHANADDIIFMDNATAGMNAVLRSISFMPGDEILANDQLHASVHKILEFICGRSGARLILAPISLPVQDPSDILDSYLSLVTPRTRLVICDHITSKSALVLPVEEIVSEFRDRGIPVVVDGAHAPGMAELDVNRIGADWYVGNIHKWIGVPRGCCFIVVQNQHHQTMRPLIVSQMVDQGFQQAFDWPGTKDMTAIYCIGQALAFRAAIGEGAIRQHCRTVARQAARMLSGAFDSDLTMPCEFLGENALYQCNQSFMASVSLPAIPKANALVAEKLVELLYRDHGIDVSVSAIKGQIWLRVCAYIYNELADYQRLIDALESLIAQRFWQKID